MRELEPERQYRQIRGQSHFDPVGLVTTIRVFHVVSNVGESFRDLCLSA